MKEEHLKSEKKDYYSISLIIGSSLVIIAILCPAISVRGYYSSRVFGTSLYFWSFLLENYFQLGFNVSPIIINIFLFNLICVITISFIAFFKKKRKQTNKKYMGLTFTLSIIMILLTFNWIVLVEYIHIINEIPLLLVLDIVYVDWYPPGSMWWDYTYNFGIIGIFLGSFIILIGSIYEMKNRGSWYISPAICITILFIIYSFLSGLLFTWF